MCKEASENNVMSKEHVMYIEYLHVWIGFTTYSISDFFTAIKVPVLVFAFLKDNFNNFQLIMKKIK